MERPAQVVPGVTMGSGSPRTLAFRNLSRFGMVPFRTASQARCEGFWI